MRRTLCAAMICGALILMMGCASGGQYSFRSLGSGWHRAGLPKTPLMPPPGFLFAQVQAPLSLNYHHTPVDPHKTGQSVSLFVQVPFTYGLLSFGWMDDPTIESAMRNGGLTRVDYADYEIFNVLGIYSEFRINAYGE